MIYLTLSKPISAAELWLQANPFPLTPIGLKNGKYCNSAITLVWCWFLPVGQAKKEH